MVIPYIICCFVATVIIEGAIMLIITKSKKDVYYSFLANLLTNPAMNALLMVFCFFFPIYSLNYAYIIVLAVLETIALFVEAKIYTYLNVFDKKRSFWYSLLLNGVSCILGFLLGFVFIF